MGDPPAAGLELVADAATIAAACEAMAAQIDADHPDGLTLVGLLPDSVVFLADLARRLTVRTEIDFVAVSAHDLRAGRARLAKDLDAPPTGRPVVLAAVLVDTGLTIDFLRRHLTGLAPSTLRIAALGDRTARRLVPVDLAYRGFEVPADELVGYGLDHRGRYRNLEDLWRVDPVRFEAR